MINYGRKSMVIQCARCKDIMQSEHVHNYVECSCGATFTDGGDEYGRYGGEAIVLKDFNSLQRKEAQ